MKFLTQLFLSLSLILSSAVWANDFPSKPVRIVTAMPVGSGPDVVARKIAEQLTKTWNVPVVVENKPGGSGTVAIQYFLSLPNDGHSVFYNDITIFTGYPILYKKEEILDDFRMLTPVLSTPWFLAVSPQIAGYQDLTKQVQNNQITFGSWAIGSSGHTASLELARHLKAQPTHIVYKDYSQWFSDLATQRLPFSFVSFGSTRQLVESGRLRYMAVTGRERHPLFPGVPTINELLGKDFLTPHGVVAFAVNKRMDAQQEKVLLSGIQQALNQSSVTESIRSSGFSSMRMSQSEFVREHQKHYETIRKLVNDFKISID